MAKDQKQQDPEQYARSVALRLLARREHSRMELTLKLRQRKIEQSVIERVLDDYEQEGWLSDERFADVYARQRKDLGYGPLRILAELQQRGIQRTPECLAKVNAAEWSERALRIRERKFGIHDIRDDWPEKSRQARFLSQQGYSGEQVEWAVDRIEPPTTS